MARAHLVVAAALFLVNPAFAQGPSTTSSNAASEAPKTPLERAHRLVQTGALALKGGRETEARKAFDAALDVFLDASPKATDDQMTQTAYRELVAEIHALEVAAGPNRQPLAPAKPGLEEPTPGSDTPPAGKADPVEGGTVASSTLAELGARIETIQPTDEERRSTEAVLGGESIDLPIELNNQVLGAIDLYTGRFNKWFSAALSRGIPHLPRIREILATAGIPQDLAYVPIVESAFNPSALSRAKARGLWQFIPSTGKQYGLKQDFFIDERADIEKATIAAAQYLKNLYAMFGDWNLALAGYNAGEGNVQRAIKRAQTNDFWALTKTRSFRSETKNYVPLIHAAIVIAKSPQSYGIDVTPLELTASERIRLSGSYPLATVAKCANTDAGELRRLNPALRRGITPQSAFELDVPSGSGALATECLAAERTFNFTRHTVRKRDTLSLISKMFGVPAAEIARINGLAATSVLRPGTELAIPKVSLSKVAATAPAKGEKAVDPFSYTIRKGDTLSSVAARHSTTVDAIKALNGLNSSRLSIGQILRVTSAASASSPEE